MKTNELLGNDKPVFSSLPAAEQDTVLFYAYQILECFDGGSWMLAKEIWETAQAELSTDIQAAIWEFLDGSRSRERAFLKGDDRKYLESE